MEILAAYETNFVLALTCQAIGIIIIVTWLIALIFSFAGDNKYGGIK
jgi:hypothetical protein